MKLFLADSQHGRNGVDANRTSVTSTSNSTANKGVCQALAIGSHEHLVAVQLGSGRDEIGAQPSGTGSAMDQLVVVREQQLACGVQQEPPKMNSIHSKRVINATPAKMNAARRTNAPNTPQNSTRR